MEPGDCCDCATGIGGKHAKLAQEARASDHMMARARSKRLHQNACPIESRDHAEVVWLASRSSPAKIGISPIQIPATTGPRGPARRGSRLDARGIRRRDRVFNVLEPSRSPSSTYEAESRIDRDEDATQLAAALDDADVPNQDWTTSTRILCKQCSEGRPHEQHDHELERRVERPASVRYRCPRTDNCEGSHQQTGRITPRWLIRFELKLAPLSQH